MIPLLASMSLLIPSAVSHAEEDDGKVAGLGQDMTVAVLDLKAPPELANLGRRLSRLVVSEAASLGLLALDEREVLSRLGPAAGSDLIECGSDPVCLAAALRDLPVNRAIVGALDRSSNAYTVEVVYVDLDSERVLGRFDRAVLIASRRLDRDVREAVPALLTGSIDASGLLRIVTGISGGTVYINGEQVSVRAPVVELRLHPGRHHLRIVAADHLPFERYVEVVAGETTELEPRLFMDPGRAMPSQDDAGEELLPSQQGEEHEGVSRRGRRSTRGT